MKLKRIFAACLALVLAFPLGAVAAQSGALDVAAQSGGGEPTGSEGYASTLLIEAEDEHKLPEEGEVLGTYDDMYLVGFEESVDAEFIDGASENMEFSVAGEVPDADVSSDGNAFGHLQDELDALGKKDSATEPIIALIDTGAGPGTWDSVSMLGDDGMDRHGHGTKMLETILGEDADARVISIKALDDAGHGDAASIYAAIEYAIERKVNIINLSLSGKAAEGNAAVEKAISDAVGAGILVVGAAGNNGKDAKDYLPGGLEAVLSIGTCDENGVRLASSNYGDSVDGYILAESTSYAAARISGLLSKYNGDVETVFGKGGAIKDASGTSSGEAAGSGGDGFSAAATITNIVKQPDGKNVVTFFNEFPTDPYFVIDNQKINLDNVTIYDTANFRVGKYGTSDTADYNPILDGATKKVLYYVGSSGTNDTNAKNGVLKAGKHVQMGDMTSTSKLFDIRCNDSVFGYDGRWYDLIISVHYVMIENSSDTQNSKYPILFSHRKPAGYDYHTLIIDSSKFYNTVGGNTQSRIGVRMTMTYKVVDRSGASPSFSGASVMMGYDDLDQQGFPDRLSTGIFDYTEGVILWSTPVNNTPVYVGKRLTTEQSPGNTHFYGAESTTGQASLETGMRWLGDPAGTKITWAGFHAGTIAAPDFKDVLRMYNVRTIVKWQDKDGNWTDSSGTVGEETTVNSRLVKAGSTYSYTYPYTNASNAVYYDRYAAATNEWPADDATTAALNPTVSATINANTAFGVKIFRRSYTRTFHGNAPSGTATDVPSAITKLAENVPGAVGDPSLVGYTFLGWNEKADGTGAAYGPDEAMLSDKDLYAQWEPITYKVRYNANGASNYSHETGEYTQNKTEGTMPDSVFTYNVKGALDANAFTREGYSFAGWNTEADGTGTSYADKYANVLNWADTQDAVINLYAQWKKKLGTEALTVISEETGNAVPNVKVALYKKVNGTWADTGIRATTNAQGRVSAKDLHWFDYEWRSVSVPDGYRDVSDISFSIYPNCNTDGTLCSHTSGTRPTDGHASLSVGNTRILYMEHVSLVLESTVSEVIKGEHYPAFLYHVKGRDAAGVEHEYDVMVQAGSGLSGTNSVPDMFAGTYAVTQTPVSRYVPGSAVGIKNASVSGTNGTANLLDAGDGAQAHIKFPYTIRQVGGFSSMDSEDNRIHK